MSTLDMERIYLQFSGKVTGYLQARLHNMSTAEDLCAEVFEKALRKQEGYDPEKAKEIAQDAANEVVATATSSQSITAESEMQAIIEDYSQE